MLGETNIEVARPAMPDVPPPSALLRLARGSMVALTPRASATSLRWLSHLWARGLVPMLLHPRLSAAEREQLTRTFLAALDLGDADDAAVRWAEVDEKVTRPADGDLAAIVFSSGTTGVPKGVELTWGGLRASALAAAERLGLGTNDRWLGLLPLSHVGGLSIVSRCLLVGCSALLHPRFDPERVVSAIRTGQVSHVSVVPTMLTSLLDADRDRTLSKLRALICGGAPTPAELTQRCIERGVPLWLTYGLSESASLVSLSPAGEKLAPPTSASGWAWGGALVRGAQVRITEGGAVLDAETEGDIEVRGPMMMRGYRGGVALGDAWFATGDRGALSPYAHESVGHSSVPSSLWIRARRQDLILTGGENVYPAEVERALLEHPQIVQALVFGVPDNKWGQSVAAAIVLGTADPPLAVNELSDWLRARLGGHRRPRKVAIVASLPVRSLDKPDRAAAAERLRDLLVPIRG